MHDDADFLAAVAANPTDQLTRLVYADWLDERNDPRGELVRIEEEVRFEPAWSDVLWSQKPRRNELRAKCDPAWLTAMLYGTNCLPLFYGRPFPDDWRDGWRLIREATERWLGAPMPDVGGHADEVAAVEARLCLTLPPSVREFVAYVHDVGEVRDGLRVWYGDICRFEVLPEVEALCLLEMSAGEGRYSVDLEDFHLINPPLRRYDEIWEIVDGQMGRWVVPSRRRNFWATLTEYMFDNVTLLRRTQAEFSIELDDHPSFLEALRADFPTETTTTTGATYFESGGLFVELRQSHVRNGRLLLEVCVLNPLQVAEVPSSLAWIVSQGGNVWNNRPFHGVFSELPYRSPSQASTRLL